MNNENELVREQVTPDQEQIKVKCPNVKVQHKENKLKRRIIIGNEESEKAIIKKVKRDIYEKGEAGSSISATDNVLKKDETSDGIDILLKTINQQYNVINLRDLEIGKFYPINGFRFMDSSKGRRVVAEINDGTNVDKDSIVYLPERYTNRFNDETIDLYPDSQVALVYGGLKPTKGGKFSYHDIEFKKWTG